jgi:hypothetical protein
MAKKRKLPGEFTLDESDAPEDIVYPRTPAHFAARIALKRQVIADDADSDQDTALIEDDIYEQRKTALTDLVHIAQHVAQQANIAGIEPEMRIGKTTIKHKENRLKRINKVSRPNKHVKTERQTVHDGGWLLTRSAGYIGKRRLVQEVMLGTDGGLYTYFRDDIPSWDGAATRPISRHEVKMSTRHEIAPPWGVVELASFGQSLNFNQLTGPDDYPLPGVNGMRLGIDVQIVPEDIQRGLEEFIVENNL